MSRGFVGWEHGGLRGGVGGHDGGTGGSTMEPPGCFLRSELHCIANAFELVTLPSRHSITLWQGRKDWKEIL